jgi:hypothetical protein
VYLETRGGLLFRSKLGARSQVCQYRSSLVVVLTGRTFTQGGRATRNTQKGMKIYATTGPDGARVQRVIRRL